MYRCVVLRLRSSSRESSLTPMSGLSESNDDRIARPRSSDCDVPVLPFAAAISPILPRRSVNRNTVLTNGQSV